MPRHPTADDGFELANLHSEPAIIPRRNAKCIFVEPKLSAAVARVEAAIEPRLGKEINVRPKLRVQKQGQPRGKEIVDLAVDQSRRRLLEMVTFDIDRPA